MGSRRVVRQLNIFFGALVLLSLLTAVPYRLYRSYRKTEIRRLLWEELKPVALENCGLRRYGAALDGGYPLCGELLADIESAYSYGIAGRDSWGCEVSSRHNVPVHQYDCFDLRRVTCPAGELRFHEECVGSKEEIIEGRASDSPASQIKKNGDGGKHLVFKLDVEGAEVESLAADATIFDTIDQLVVEFHGAEEPALLDLVRTLNETFYIVDVHFNNFSCHEKYEPFPAIVYEVLFVSKRLGKLNEANPLPEYPNPLWKPNHPKKPDCQRDFYGRATL